MAITVVQTQSISNSFSGDFSSNVTAGNTVFLVVFSYAAADVTISSSSPQVNGNPVTGATELITVQAPFSGGGTVYAAIWMLPDVTGGATGVSVTVTNGSLSTSVGVVAYEVSGLGTTPSLDQSSTGSGTTGSVTSGSSGNTASSPELIIGAAATYGGSPSGPDGYANTTMGLGFVYAGEQVAATSGNSYSYATGSGTATWCAGVVTVESSAATPSGITYQMRRIGR